MCIRDSGGTVHVDGGAQRDGDGVHVLIQTQLFAQSHVHGDVGGGAAGEEGGQAGLIIRQQYQEKEMVDPTETDIVYVFIFFTEK